MYLPHVPQAAQPETGPEEDLTKVLPDLPLQEALDQAAQAAQPAQPREPAAHSTQPRQTAVPPVPPTRNPRAVPPEEPEEEPVRRGVSGGILAAIVGGALVLLAVVIFFGYGLVLKGGDTIYPNVFVAGINVGGMTSEEAVAAVADAVAASYSSATLDVQLPDRTLSFTPDQTNVALDADEAIAEAMAYGRSGNPFSAVLNYFSCRSNERYIDLQTVLNLDTDYIRNRIDELAQEVETTLSPSKVDVNEAAGTITVQVGYPDRQLDTEGLYEAVYNAFMNSDFTTLTWDYQETPCELVDLTPYYEQYCTEVQNAEYDEETHTISEEVPGYGFDLEAAQQQLATAEPGSTVVIQMEDIEPEVTKLDLSSEMFGTALHKVSTKYAVNSNRTNNLDLACKAINGTILNPGEIFSFNDVVGERTAAKGYLPATVFVTGGASESELGGGVCQVASSIYYCSLFLNLEQVHREPHMYVVDYVDFGMDATVYWGSIDYQFKNTLDYPIKIQANIDGGTVNITFWGPEELDFTVETDYKILETYPWTTVEQVDETKPVGYRERTVSPYTGYKVVAYITVKDLDGNVLESREVYSTYRKRDQVYVVGPAEEVPDPDDPTTDPDDPTTDPDDPLNPDDPLAPSEDDEGTLWP
ncbi:MAG TPA: VanW family protein [Candidatus Avoscillospira stercorigallinarum]|uniref:VanW family protein n=1 Tax=Candidatus Avoscillospira stercorigallinarum TaxID=2840708 RepID=A0A9D0Z3X9_9FIRM|nr:VanW family protein [Candidatus Avoscillospira stercorigallinarum]